MQIPPFLHIDAGHIITWVVVAVAWIANRGMDWRSLQERMKWVESWQQHHQEECEEREKAIRRLESACEKLAVIVELSERRITALESRGFRH